MAFRVSELTPYLRTMLLDEDQSLQQFTDDDLTNKYLVVAIKVENAILGDLGCGIQLNDTDPEVDPYWEFIVEPQDWLQIFYCVAACLRMRSWEQVFSLDNGVIKTTAHNTKDVVNALRETYNDILQEHKYGAIGFSFSSWDDFYTRPNLTLNAISQGYR